MPDRMNATGRVNSPIDQQRAADQFERAGDVEQRVERHRERRDAEDTSICRAAGSREPATMRSSASRCGRPAWREWAWRPPVRFAPTVARRIAATIAKRRKRSVTVGRDRRSRSPHIPSRPRAASTRRSRRPRAAQRAGERRAPADRGLARHRPRRRRPASACADCRPRRRSSPSRRTRRGCGRSLRGGIDHLGRLHPLRQPAQPPVDLAQPLAAIDVVAILRPVAIARRPGNHLDQLGPLVAEQLLIFGAQRRIAGGRDVVRAMLVAMAQPGRLLAEIPAQPRSARRLSRAAG